MFRDGEKQGMMGQVRQLRQLRTSKRGQFLGSILGSGGYYHLLKLSCGFGLNYIISPDVSTTFPASFFTVMPKGLTTGPKSMCDRSCRITIMELGKLCTKANAKSLRAAKYILRH